MFDGKYFDWNQKKIKGILDFYGHQFFAHKRILDLGCGHGDISATLYRLGAEVTAVDARQEHLKVVSSRYPGIKLTRLNLNETFNFQHAFDLTLNLSLLCHLSNYEFNLRSTCAISNQLVLETAACDTSDPYKYIYLTDNINYDTSINGSITIPSIANIERILKECGMSFQRLDLPKFNSGPYYYNWLSENNNSYDYHKRRIWFCKKEINNKTFVKNNIITSIPKKIQDNKLENSNITVNHPVLHTYKEEVKLESPEEINTLKVALCISGHMRTFKDNFSNLHKNILSKLNCDVFIHTWNTLDSYKEKINDNQFETLQRYYNPKSIIIEPKKEFQITNLMRSKAEPGRNVHNMLSMFYKIEACNNLKKEYEIANNFKYDLVIRFRSDISMLSPLPITNKIDNDLLYVPLYGNFSGLCDQLAFGSSETMDKYSCIFSNIENHLNNGASFNPEKMTKFHVQSMNLPVHKIDMKFVLKRLNGLVQNNMLLERALGFIR